MTHSDGKTTSAAAPACPSCKAVVKDGVLWHKNKCTAAPVAAKDEGESARELAKLLEFDYLPSRDMSAEALDRVARRIEPVLAAAARREVPAEVWSDGYDAGFAAGELKHTDPDKFAKEAEAIKQMLLRALAEGAGKGTKP
jgi:hypothetical protein